jgi:hypothetical protein
MATFNSLPYEIRAMVYRLALVNEHPVAIASPCPKHKYSGLTCPHRGRIRIDQPKNFANLSRVSKQVNAEACTVFYSLNTFLVSNNSDDYHPPHLANFHGLQAFKARVPVQKIGLIRQIHCAMHIPVEHSSTSSRRDEWKVNEQSLADIRSMGRSLEKYFCGVESVRFIVLGHFYGEEDVSVYRILPRNDAVLGVAWPVKRILKLEKLKEVRYHQSTLQRLPELVEKTLKKEPKARREIKVVMDSFRLENSWELALA